MFYALRGHKLDAFGPLNRAVKLADQRVANGVRRGFALHINVVHHRNSRGVKGNFLQLNRQLFRRRFHQRAVGRDAYRQRQRAFGAGSFTGGASAFYGFFVARDNHLTRGVEVDR
nr:Uncharacterised protein [Raoultella sp. NCTC 9187]